MSESPSMYPHPSPPTGAGRPDGGKKILLVDDDRATVLAVTAALDAQGYDTRSAATVDLAVKIARDYRPDAVVVELRVGTDDGLSLIPSLRRHFPEITTVVLTGHADIDSAISALRHRVDDFLRKPILPGEVVRVLGHCLSRAQARQHTRDIQARENFFGRLLVRRFSRLFIEDNASLPVEKFVSRRILPGFFVAVDMMLGPELVEDYQRQCREIVNRLGSGNGADVPWEDFYADEEASKLALDAEVKMALHFREVEKRVVWLTTLINNHLGGAGHHSGAQVITPKETTNLLSFLFSDLIEILSKDGGRRLISSRYGEDACARLVQVAGRFQADRQH